MSVGNSRDDGPAEESSNVDLGAAASDGRDEVVALRPALVRCLCRGAVVQGMPIEVQKAHPPPVSSSNRHLTFRNRHASHAFRIAEDRKTTSPTNQAASRERMNGLCEE